MNNCIEVEATLEKLDTVLEFVEVNLEAMDCPMKVAMKIAVCVEELYVNIANYAYDGQIGKCRIDIEYDEKLPWRVRISLTDSGKYFNPLDKEAPDITLDVEEREIGGLGIFMVKNIMDNISYERKQENNIIIMEKNW